MDVLHLDFESRGPLDIKEVGLANYLQCKETEPLMLAHSLNTERVDLWQEHLTPELPNQLKDALLDPYVKKSAWNCSFERGTLKEKFGIWVPYEQWEDPQVSARYLSMPGSLDDVSEILNLPPEMAKDKEGKRLINMFSKPSKKKKKRGEDVEYYFRDWNTDPEDWEKFCEYCKRDVIAEREIQRRLTLLKVFPLPPKERKLWEIDQRINDRGIFVDLGFVRSAAKLATRAKEEAVQRQNELTGLENANSNSQMLEWVQTQGFVGNTLRKERVELAINDLENGLTPLARQVLKARKEASSTSYKKLDTLIRHISPNGRLKNQFIFLGSPRAGRFSGAAVQLQNLARPDKQFEDIKILEEARNMIYAEDYEGIKKKFGSVLLTVKSCIRTVFVAPPKKEIIVSDFNAVETRVGAWMCGCKPLLDVFDILKYPPKGRDPYIAFAVIISGIPYEKIEADLESKDSKIKAIAKELRQWAKAGVLQCIYRAGGGGLGKNKYGDIIKKGLWGFLTNMGIDITQEKCHEIVRVFRAAYKEIEEAWYAYEDAVKDVLKEGTTRVKRVEGPNGIIKFDKLTIQNRLPILRIQLPSGRFLHYLDARWDDVLMPWRNQTDDSEVYKKGLVYSGINQDTKQWSNNIVSHGGKLFENICQGAARDLLMEAMIKADAIGLEIVGHAHDEIIAERDLDPFAPGIEELEGIMSEKVDWAEGLPIRADGFAASFYHK